METTKENDMHKKNWSKQYNLLNILLYVQRIYMQILVSRA